MSARPASQGALELLGSWSIGGSTELVDDVVRLTNDQQGQSGWMWSKSQAGLRPSDAWRVDLEFQIHGKGVSLFGDGMALWLTREPYRDGSNFGHSTTYSGLGVFFDTYDNSPGMHTRKYPYIAAIAHDGASEYVHNAAEFARELELAPGCHDRIRQFGSDPKVITVRMEHDPVENMVHGSLLVDREAGGRARAPPGSWRKCFSASASALAPPESSSGDPAGAFYIGVSASTGDLTDTHDILSIEFATRGEVSEQGAPTAAPAEAAAAPAEVAAAPQAASAPGSSPERERGPFCDLTSTAELNEAVRAAGPVRELLAKAEAAAEAAVGVRQRMAEQVSRVDDQMTDALGRIRQAEGDLETQVQTLTRRIADLEERLARAVARQTQAEDAGVFGRWLLVGAVVVLLAAVVLLSTSVCRQGDQLRKVHVW